MSNLSVLILAGGLATRIRPLTSNFPKALIDINGTPFLGHQLQLLKKQGFENIVLSVAFEGEQIEEVFGDGDQLGVSIQYAYDGDTLLGTGGAIRQAFGVLSDPFLVLYGDSYLETDYQKIISAFQEQRSVENPPLGLMTVYRNQDLYDRSNIIFQDGEIQCYDKHNQTPEMHHIDWGLGILTKEAFSSFTEDIFDLALVYEHLVAKGRLMGHEVSQRFYEIGSFEGIETFREYQAAQGCL